MNLKALHKLLTSKTAKEIFPDEAEAETLYRKFATICHPDANPDNCDLAGETFKLLEQRKRELTAGIFIHSKKGTYEVERTPIYTGDVADFYKTKDGLHTLKVARTDKTKDLMMSEAKILPAIRPVDGDMRFFFPSLVESFVIGQKNHPNRQCNVFKSPTNQNWVSLQKVKVSNKELDPRHLGWIFKRMMVALTLTHRAGYVHGAVVPQHFLVNTEHHGGRLIGWCHAKPIGETIKFIPKGAKAFYPPEVLDKKPVTPATDIYMAAMCMIDLMYGHLPSRALPGSCPSKLNNFFRALLMDNPNRRPDDAWELHKAYDEVLRVVFGKPQFVPLTTGD